MALRATDLTLLVFQEAATALKTGEMPEADVVGSTVAAERVELA